jgi:hypothetical protein
LEFPNCLAIIIIYYIFPRQLGTITIQVGSEDIPVVLGDQLFEMHQHLAMTFISPT